jgi:type II secretory pathway pseudopilin PulG
MRQRRPAITLFDMLALLAILAVLLGLMIPAVPRIREAAKRTSSMNNLRQLGIAVQDYSVAYGNILPPGLDDKGFSASVKLLPFIEADNYYKQIDFKKSIDDKANAKIRKMQLKSFLSARDPILTVKNGWGATNYLYNDKVFFLNSKASIPASFLDGTSNTVIIGETLKGDNGTKAVSVQRQYVLLDKKALKGLKDDAGVDDFKNDKHIAGDRCASWMDGHFLQGMFNARLLPNDKRPDVSCAGIGGVSSLRSLDTIILVSMADGSAHVVSDKITHKTWKNAVDPKDGNALGADW